MIVLEITNLQFFCGYRSQLQLLNQHPDLFRKPRHNLFQRQLFVHGIKHLADEESRNIDVILAVFFWGNSLKKVGDGDLEFGHFGGFAIPDGCAPVYVSKAKSITRKRGRPTKPKVEKQEF